MTNEEFEKMKEFLIRQQAQFDVDIEKLKETTKVIAQATLANTAMIGTLIEAQKISEEKIAKLSDKVDKLADKIDKQSDKTSEIDDRLNSLIIIVEKHITEAHNGKSRRRSRKKSDK